MKLVFPIHARRLDHHRHRSKIHAAEIILIICVGLLVPSVIVGTTEYNITNFPPTQCAANADIHFYTLTLPTIFLMATGVILILLSFMSIHKVSSYCHCLEMCIISTGTVRSCVFLLSCCGQYMVLDA